MLPSKLELIEITKYLIADISTSTISSTTVIQNKKELNPDYEMINHLFATTSIVEKKSKTNATNTLTTSDYPIGSKENPIINHSFTLWKENLNIYLGWMGNIDYSPKIFCDEMDDGILCQEKIKVYSFTEEIGDLDYFPNETEIIIVAVGSNIYAVEALDNPFKKLQLLYQGEKPEFRIFKNNIYIKDNNLLAKLKI